MSKKKFIILSSLAIILTVGIGLLFAWGFTGPSEAPPGGSGLIHAYNSNIGIGTSTPGYKLTVAGEISAANNKIRNVAAPLASSDAATMEYVDAAASLPGFLCPSQIESSDRAAAILVAAITTCRNLGNNWRLPTAEEISCFIGAAGVSTGYLWTRSPGYGGSSNWVYVRLTDGIWSNYLYSNTYPFRCVR